MKDGLNLIVMLTNNDKTVDNAYEIFEKCKDSKAKCWGFKEEPLPLEEMKKLYTYMNSFFVLTYEIMLMNFFVLRLTKFDIGYIIFLKIKHKDI